MASQASLEKMELRKNYRNLWHTDLLSTIKADCPFCCLALWCAPCVSYMLRKRALYNDMSRYVCCAGYLPCSGKCGESKCPELCLCTEVFCCFGNSVASTRFLLQDEFNIQTTQCDNCIIGFMFCLQQLACIVSCIAMIVGSEELQEASQILNCLSDLVYCTVCACMQTQHKVEMDKRDGKFGPQPVWLFPKFSRCLELISLFHLMLQVINPNLVMGSHSHRVMAILLRLRSSLQATHPLLILLQLVLTPHLVTMVTLQSEYKQVIDQ
ncbi:hypothetical protein HPP92_007090 [Vanilla planifolia]|uniref:PLAC8 family protein n=1 Tax=Vanilla planifolia TaxID=51239 RepID=A0A835RQJ0_VANPL|nr:hypothetical protein HPP92_007090 [Vanilla planifolia]